MMMSQSKQFRERVGTVVLWNVGLGYRNKISFIEELTGTAVICLNEGNFDSEFKLRGYVTYTGLFESKGKSLATILVREDVTQYRVNLPNVGGVNMCVVRVSLGGKRLNICTCYISPNVKPDLVSLRRVLVGLENLVLLGDLNGKSTAWGSPVTDERGRQLLKIMDDLNLSVLNDGSFTFRRKFQAGIVESHLDVGCVSSSLVKDVYMEIDPTPVGSDHCKLRVFMKGVTREKWRTVHVTDWVIFRREVDVCVKNGSDIDNAILECKRKCTRGLRVLPNCPSPDMRLAGLIGELRRPGVRSVKSDLFTDFTVWEMNLAIESCNPKSAPGPDHIGNREIKSLSEEAKLGLLKVINRTVREGQIPDKWKEGVAIPLLKSGKKATEVESYRLIVKTSNVCKLMERMIVRRLYVLLENRSLLSDHESAYRTLRGTHDNILDLT